MDNSRLIQLINEATLLALKDYGWGSIFIELERIEQKKFDSGSLDLYYKAMDKHKGYDPRQTKGLVISLEESEIIKGALEGSGFNPLNFNTSLVHFNTENSRKLIIYRNKVLGSDCLSTAEYILIKRENKKLYIN
ncbi:MAG: hypothetical protein ABIJ14_01940 [Nanoarchaeota archaeon]|nr:hypothetical protein [Nanoarchaeota archaeon]